MYFAKTSNELVAKNSLQALIQGIIKFYDRALISNDDIDAFKSEIINEINKLNKQNPRCKSVNPKFHCWNGRDITLHFGEGIITLTLFHSASSYCNYSKETQNVSETKPGLQLGARAEEDLPF